MRSSKFNWEAWVFIFPALVLLFVFLVWPTLQTIFLSFYKGTILNSTAEFVALDNYERMLTRDRLFLRVTRWPPSGAVVNTVIWLIFFPALTVALGLLVAVLSDRTRYEPIIKSVIFVPMAISATAASVIFRFVYSPDTNIGVINAGLNLVLPEFEPVPWLGRKELVNFAVIGAAVWIWTGLAMTVLSAAYKAIPTEILEAAIVDGASPWQRFWKVALPMLKQPMTFVAVTMVINALKLVDLILVMTDGGPRGGSRIIGFSVYWEMFNNGKTGYGSAIAVVLLVLVMPIIIYQLRQIKRGG